MPDMVRLFKRLIVRYPRHVDESSNSSSTSYSEYQHRTKIVSRNDLEHKHFKAVSRLRGLRDSPNKKEALIAPPRLKEYYDACSNWLL